MVNALWAGGAEAMTIQGQRVISTTGIKCVGNTVMLHGVTVLRRRTGSPRSADPAELQASLDDSDYVSCLPDLRGRLPARLRGAVRACRWSSPPTPARPTLKYARAGAGSRPAALNSRKLPWAHSHCAHPSRTARRRSDGRARPGHRAAGLLALARDRHRDRGGRALAGLGEGRRAARQGPVRRTRGHLREGEVTDGEPAWPNGPWHPRAAGQRPSTPGHRAAASDRGRRRRARRGDRGGRRPDRGRRVRPRQRRHRAADADPGRER